MAIRQLSLSRTLITFAAPLPRKNMWLLSIYIALFISKPLYRTSLVNSPNALEGNKEEDTAGAAFQSEKSGLVDFAGDRKSVV